MNLLYINGGLSVSETFIKDLLFSLAETTSLTFLTSSNFEINNDKVKVKNLSYNQTRSPLANKLHFITGNKYKLKSDISYVKKRCTDFLRKNKFDVAYIEYGTTSVLFSELLNHFNIPYVVHFHGFDASSAFSNPSYKHEIQKVFHSAASIIVPSQHLKRLLILQGGDVNKIFVVPYGINNDIIKPHGWDKRFEISPNPVLTFVGRLTPKKNPIALLYAFHTINQNFPDAELNIVGDGPLMADCRKKVHDLDIKNVKLWGALPRQKVYEILNKSWIYMQHSVTSYNGDQEGLPNSISEASAFGLPVVSTIHSGITENVLDRETGFLVKEYDYEQMAEKAMTLLKDKDLVVRMGGKGREFILNLCNHKKRVEQVYNLLQKAVN
ncbi:glycosyltransferase family 4 protein [Pontibacter qinzhouensis]|uniref:Glycosyltransferase family 4 protein n=1 Tax=Pontibacter qinzhouensis TaxID=2603253 RepID=A0A5C8K6A4_9BACT|nr:glycosyltransferase family 4 protein [Pontibacter qinzhouensis]TXK46968.1 glycosyltransferase family 4 protein [Pontibacter qinzhouensis]